MPSYGLADNRSRASLSRSSSVDENLDLLLKCPIYWCIFSFQYNYNFTGVWVLSQLDVESVYQESVIHDVKSFRGAELITSILAVFRVILKPSFRNTTLSSRCGCILYQRYCITCDFHIYTPIIYWALLYLFTVIYIYLLTWSFQSDMARRNWGGLNSKTRIVLSTVICTMLHCPWVPETRYLNNAGEKTLKCFFIAVL